MLLLPESLEPLLDFLSGFLSEDLSSVFAAFLSDLLSVLVDSELASDGFPPSPAMLRLFPDLKSVSYQPPPFNLNATADTFFLNLSF